MATELGKAYVQIVPSARGISGKIQGAISGEVQSAGASAGSGIVSAIKGAIIAAGIGKFLGASLSEGARLQQSLGGIETLFKDNADKVKAYAKEAYQSTGLSANAYMQSVTGFSASLLQSLGGDTAKAADISNMAMVDMADNSNKMGTSMEAIQNAYQGFAKQNYTMLDNLKLGYGGTKEEMKRLLADAERLTGVKYDINNLSDVYQAIHAIQENLDITGTTAKEASSTFTGSFNAMKASAQNVLGNLSLGEDIKPSLHQLVSTTKTFLVNNLWPMFKNIISGLADVVITEFPKVISKIGELFDNGLKKVFGENRVAIDLFKTAIISLGTAFLVFQGIMKIITLFQAFKKSLIAVKGAVVAFNLVIKANPMVRMISIVMAVAAALIYFFTQTETGKAIFKSVVDFIKNAWNSLVEFFTNLWTDISNSFNTLVEDVKIIWNGLVAFLTTLWETLKTTASLVWQSIVDAIVLVWEMFKNTAMTVWQAIVDTISAVLEPYIAIFSAIWDGMRLAVEIIWESIKALVNVAIEAVKGIIDGVMQILSGDWEGGWNTIKETLNIAWEAMKDIVDTLINTIWGIIKDVWNSIYDTISGILDSIWGKLSDTWNSIVKTVIEAVNNVYNAAKEAWENLKTATSDAVDSVFQFFDRLWNINLFDAGKAILEGFLNGLKSVWGSVQSFVGDIAGWIAANKGPISYDRKLLIPAGSAIMGGLNKGLSESFKTVKNTVSSMAGDIKNQFGTEDVDISVSKELSTELSLSKILNTDFKDNKNIELLVSQVSKVENILQAILDKDVNTYLDGEVLAKDNYARQLKMIKREGI